LLVASTERLLVVAPHPDDETIGAGGLMQRVLERGGSVRVVLITAGDGYIEGVRHETREPRPRPAEFVRYGERRVRESRAALRELGAGEPIPLTLLGFPDGGLERLLLAHWWRTDREQSGTTDATHPPYREALDPELPYDGDDLRAALTDVVRATQPTLVALPDFLDRHPDHRAAGLFTLLALEQVRRETGDVPRMLAYLVHWPGWPPGWDQPRARPEDRQHSLRLPADLPDRGLEQWFVVLSRKQVLVKGAALARYATQQEVMAPLLATFVRTTEPFTELTTRDLDHVDARIADATAK